METQKFHPNDERPALMQARLSWGFFFIAMLLLTGTCAFETMQRLTTVSDAPVQRVVGPTWLTLLAFIAAYPLGHTWRMQTFKKAWRGSRIEPRKYLQGHALMACCLALVPLLPAWIALQTGDAQSYAAAAAAAFLAAVALLINVPRSQLKVDPPDVTSL